jgi:hypothetical protein
MSLKQAITLSYPHNVGTADRVFRLISGVTLMAAGWHYALPLAATIGLTLAGAMWTSTAVLSKCSIYYALGYSTCPVSGKPAGSSS